MVFLFESYNGAVDNTRVENCETYDSTHGFVSKTKKTKFINCKATNHATNGFAFISDNIPSATNQGLCFDNTVVNCEAYNCQFGLNTYCRDYWSTSNANNIVMKSLKIEGFLSSACSYGYSFGDSALTAPAGQTYNVCQDITGVNLKEELSTVESFMITRLINSSLSNLSINTKAITWRTDTWNQNVRVTYASALDNVNSMNFFNTMGTGFTPTLLSMYSYFKSANTSAKTITNFIGGTSDRVVFIMIDEDFTSIAPNTNLSLYRTYQGKGSWVMLKYKDGVWYDIAGWTPEKMVPKQVSIVALNQTLDDSTNMWDVIFYQTTDKKIGFALPTVPKQKDIAVTVRNTVSGDLSYGGFDTTNLIIPTGIPTTLTYGKTLVMKFMYIPQLAAPKYACVSWQYI
jgi:hypothetical protein